MHFFARVKIISTLVFYQDFMRKLSFFLVFLTACSAQYQPKSIQYKDYKIYGGMEVDSNYVRLLKPYGDSVNRLMAGTVGYITESLEKGDTGGSLGSFMTDAFIAMAQKSYNQKVDVAFMNSWGVRLNQIPKGPITRSHIFELMPFDNALILIKADGKSLQAFLDLVAEKGGWPVAGMTMSIKDKKAINVMIGGKAINSASTYTIAISDFIANGGDNVTVLKNLPRVNNNYLVRDALMDYVSSFQKIGQPVPVNNEIRVTNAQ
jgi:2',3'-cyclic-nucleotide 2'-phosphodiesterase (5'-nucleotidase family)